MTLGKKVKLKREELGLSQEELAEKMNYKSKTSIHKIEQDITDLPLSKVKELANILKTTPAYLMGWESIPFSVDTAPLSTYELEGLNKLLTGESSIESAYLSLDKKAPKETLRQIFKKLNKIKEEISEINLSKETHDFYINENLAGDIKYKNKKISIIMGDPKDKSTFKELDLNSDENIKLGTVISLIQLALEKVELDNQGYKGLENLISSIVIKNYNEKETQKKKLIRTKRSHSIDNLNKNVTELAALKGMHKK